jgi:AraC-like DNA-binding protein
MLQGFHIAILVQSLILAALCFTVRRNDRINYWLGIYFVSIALQRMYHLVLNGTKLLFNNPAWVFIYEISVLAGLAAIYCFVLRLLNRPIRPAWQSFAFFSGVFLTSFFIGYSLRWWSGTQGYYYHPFSTVASAWISVYTFYVAGICIGYIRKDLDAPRTQGTQLRLTLTATRWFLYYIVFRSVLALSFMGLRLSTLHDYEFVIYLESWYLLVMGFLSILLLAVMAYFALRNPAFFDHFPAESDVIEQQIILAVMPETEKRLIRPTLSSEEMAVAVANLRAYMEQEKPWLNAKLTQTKLAEQLGLPPYKLSHVLSQGLGQHFNEFVNSFRIAHAQALLMDPSRKRDTMYAIALDSGFASEAPFYAAFKKINGESPSAWREVKMSS